MKKMFRSFALVAGLAGAAITTGAQAQDGATIDLAGGVKINASAMIANDYTFRGLSQTRKEPAMQATWDLEHASGIYVGGFIGNIDFNADDGGLEYDFLIGYRKKVFNEKLAFDIGFVRYMYPAADGALKLNYNEFVLKLGYDLSPVTLVAMGAYSPKFTARGESSFYLEGGLDVKTPLWDILASGRFGRQWIQKNAIFNLPDYNNWSLALAKDLPGGFTASIGYYDTSVSKRRCFAGSGLDTVCDGRFIGSVTWKL